MPDTDTTNSTDSKGEGDKADAAGTKADAAKATEQKPAVAFKTTGEFLAEVQRKAKPMISEAVDAALKPFLEALNIESIEELPTVAEGVKKTKQALTETDQIKRDLDKTKKDLAKREERITALSGWRQTALKREALAKYSTKVSDLEILGALLEPKMVVDDEDDTVAGPNGKSLDDFVDDLLKAKPILKAPEFKDGSGTSDKTQKAKPKEGGGQSNGEDKRTAREKVAAEMAAGHARRLAEAGRS